MSNPNAPRNNPSKPSLSVTTIDEIREPGAYICRSTGHLVRVAPTTQPLKPTDAMCVVGVEPLYVAKISDDAFVAKTQARLIAASMNLSTNF